MAVVFAILRDVASMLEQTVEAVVTD